MLKYDVEVSGFGSQALGPRLPAEPPRPDLSRARTGTATKGWPTWTTPVMRWAKAQGAVTGYAHSATGLEIDPKAAAGRLLAALDTDADGTLTPRRGRRRACCPSDFAADRRRPGRRR